MTEFWGALVQAWQAGSHYFAQMPWVRWMVSLQWFFLLYFVLINLAYLGLNFVAVFGIVRYMRDHRARYLPEALLGYQPPVSIILPAYNEEKSIVSSVRSLLQVDYPEFEVVVVNDGSTDGTKEALIEAFSLAPFPEAYRKRVETEEVTVVYVSQAYPKVRLVDKVNGGKADALNAGLNCIRYPLYCAVDADCILQTDSLSRVVRPFLEDARTVASGGVVRVLNGCTVKNGRLDKVELPNGFLPGFQLVEYLRAFLFGRMGWSPFNALLIISGAFGVFYKERVVAIGGYRNDTVGEDMDLVVRLHRNLREENRDYRITFVPDPICWTEAPKDLGSLQSQRIRWQRGLAESLWPNLRLMFSRRGGTVGWLAFPFMFIFEFLGPLIELVGYVFMTVLWILGLVPLTIFLIFLAAAVGMGILLSVNAMLLEEISFHTYPRPSQQIKLFMWAVLENFGYRQLSSVWRSVGLIHWMFSRRRRHDWGNIDRDGSWQHAHTEPTPLTTPAPVGRGSIRQPLPDPVSQPEAIPTTR